MWGGEWYGGLHLGGKESIPRGAETRGSLACGRGLNLQSLPRAREFFN